MVQASYGAPYPKVPCVRYEVSMQCTGCIMSLLLEPSMSFHISYDLSLLLLPDVTCCVTT